MLVTRSIRIVAVATLLLATAVAKAASITYDFTAVVYSNSGAGPYSSIPVGTTLTGTYTFDYSQATSTTGSPNLSNNPWDFEAYGGSSTGSPAPIGLVFAQTVSDANGQIYSTPPVNSTYVLSIVSGNGCGSNNGCFEAQNYPNPNIPNTVWDSLSIVGNSTQAPVLADGLPVTITSATQGSALEADGELEEFTSNSGALGETGYLVYDLTSLTPAPVPLPAAAWLMISGLGVLSFLACSRSFGRRPAQ